MSTVISWSSTRREEQHLSLPVYSFLTSTDLHQQGSDHRVHPARLRDNGHLVTAQQVGPQGLGADLHIHPT